MAFRAPTREEILEGPVLRTMFRIGGPAVLSSLIFTLYNLADAFWIGRLPAEEAGAAVAGIQVSWPIVWFLISFVSGFGGAAVSAFVSQYIGAGRTHEATRAFNQLFSIALIAGVLLGLLGFSISPWLLSLLVGEGGVAEAANLYISIIFLGLPTMLIPGLFYFGLAATGDTVLPLLVNGGGTLLNILLDPFFVLGWGGLPRMGIVGAAYATLISQAVATAAAILILARGRGRLVLRVREMPPDPRFVLRALRVGMPAAVGQSSVAFGFVVLTGIIGRLPNAEAALAGYGIGDRVLGLLFILTDGLSVGLTTMVGQALGAERFARSRELVWKGLSLLFGLLAAEAFVLWVMREPLVALFIPGRADVIAVGSEFIAIFAAGMPFLGAFFSAQAIFRGAGHNVPTMILGILRLWALRIPLSYLLAFPLGWGDTGVWWGMSLSNVISGLIALGLLWRGGWQRRVVD
ncbi:MATE family efflux transporter [Candidatus Bipolaricaulota sp. J31]